MEESKLLELLRQHDEDMNFTVEMKTPIPASRNPEDRRKFVTFVYSVKVGGTEKGVIEERYSRARRYHWRLVQLGLIVCLQGGELSFPPMYWWRNMRDDKHNIRIRARQMQTYYTLLLSNPEEMIPILEAATADRLGDDGKVRARPPPRSLKSAMKAAEASAQGGGGAAGDGAVEGEMTTFSTAADANATDSDDDADEDGEALTSGMAFVAMPEGADDNFFGNDDGEGGGGSSFSQWEEEWEETFFDGSFTGGGGDDYSTSRHVSDSVNAMSLLDNPNRFVSYNDEADDGGSAFAHLPDADAGGMSFGGGGMVGGGMDTSTASLPEPVE